jgi:hypothetical protein
MRRIPPPTPAMPHLLLIHEPVHQRAERGEEAGRAVYQRMLDWSETLKQRGVLMAMSSLEHVRCAPPAPATCRPDVSQAAHHGATHAAINAVWRTEAPKLIATVARMVRDVGLAEELAQDALVAALEHWPVDGLPDNPGAWLMTTAKNRALDRLRQQQMHERKHEELAADLRRCRPTWCPTSSTRSTPPAPTTSATTCCA